MRVVKTHRLTTLHTILSTGSPLKPQSFDFVYENIKSDVLLGSVTGGTDIIACFAGNNVSLPVYRGEIQSLHLGCAVQSWNDDGMTVECYCILFCHGLVILSLIVALAKSCTFPLARVGCVHLCWVAGNIV